MLGDWAWWDETYRFSGNLNDAYIAANLNDPTLQNRRLNYFIVVGSNGTVLYSRGHDLRTGGSMPVPEEFLADLSKISTPLLSARDQEKNVGIMVGHGRAFFIGSSRILTSTRDNPGSGFLIIGRVIDEGELARLSDMTGGYISFDVPVNDPAENRAAFIPRPFTASAITIGQADPYRITGTATLYDTAGMPALFISIQNSRDMYQSALVLIRNYLIIITIMMALFAGLVLLLMDRLVLERLSILIGRVREGGSLPEGQHLPPMLGNDEFVQLNELITESQQKIRESEARYRRIVETAQEGIYILDPDHRIMFANDRLAEMFGLDPGEIIGRSIKDFVLEDKSGEFENRMAARKTGINERYECRLAGNGGEILWGLISAMPVFTDSAYTGSFAMITDITDRKKAELALALATKKLSTLNVLTFNDLQNQLFTLQGYIELSESIATDKKMKEYIARQRDVAGRIRQQIAFAHNIQKMGTRPPSWQGVNSVFLFAISHLDLSQVSRHIEVDNLEIYADPLFENVLYSLADNSLTHGKTMTGIRMSYRLDGKDLVILYEDNGEGIPPDKKETVFLQKYRSGSGVSLFLAREILSITGIAIRETGTYMQGARFEIRIPKGGYRFRKTGAPDTI